MTAVLIHRFLENSAYCNPDGIAIIHNRKSTTYGQLNQSANNLASWCIAEGMRQGDRALLMLENGAEYVTAYYAALKAGLVTVPISPETRPDVLQQLLATLSPRLIIASAKAEKILHDITRPPSLQAVIVVTPRLPFHHLSFPVIPFHELTSGQDDNPSVAVSDSALASVIYTSGSTGKPKGVMLTHANIVSNTYAIIQYLGLAAADRQMVVLPFFYVMGKSLLNTHIAAGGTLIINNAFAYPAAVLQQMADEKVTGFSGVPSTFAYLLYRSPLKSYRDRLPDLRYCSQAGGHMPRQVKEELLEALPSHTKLYVMYGATEAAARLAYVEPDRLRQKLDSIGIPIPGVALKVIDGAGNLLPPGAKGEIVASGSNIMAGYWDDPVGSAAVLCSHGYRTGDIGYQDEDGYFYLTGRKDNQLKVGGHRINPQEIEDALMVSNLVIETAIIGIDDKLLGKKLVAFVVPKHRETTEQEILQKCLQLLPRFKVPHEIRLVHQLAKNSSGKIDLISLQHNNLQARSLKE